MLLWCLLSQKLKKLCKHQLIKSWNIYEADIYPMLQMQDLKRRAQLLLQGSHGMIVMDSKRILISCFKDLCFNHPIQSFL